MATTNNINLGSTSILGMSLGSTIIKKAYLGNILVYDGGTTIDLNPNIDDPGNITYDPIEELL